jgi:hypothetical protein
MLFGWATIEPFRTAAGVFFYYLAGTLVTV